MKQEKTHQSTSKSPPSHLSSLSPPTSHNNKNNNRPITILRLSKNILIRSFAQNDAAALAIAANNAAIARWMLNTFPHPYGIEDATKWISIASSASPMLGFAICQSDDDTNANPQNTNTNTKTIVIGGIGLKTRGDVHHRTMQIGYWLGEPHWGQGIATDAVRGFSDWAFEHFAHLVRLEAEVFEGNDGSVRVLEKAGFAFEGRQRMAIEKMGDVRDLLVFVRFREGW